MKIDKLLDIINDREDFDRMLSILSDRVKDNNPISDNPMLDGMAISFIIGKEHFFRKLVFFNEEKEKVKVLPGSLQQVEHGLIWLTENIETICDILKKEEV